MSPAEVVPPLFPPLVVAEVKALACQLPTELGLPLSRLSRADLQRYVIDRGIVAEVSGATIWRWLHQDAIRPWTHRSWIFPRDPQFADKAGRVLDLYARIWEGKPLGSNDFVISADEKTQLQIRQRKHPTRPPASGRSMQVEHEYRRHGTCAYHAAWDVHHARLFGHVTEKSTIAAFDALVAQVMAAPPYSSADRVFWVVDNGTIHRGQRAVGRLQRQWPQLILVHLPVHASWLNQVEIYFSVLQRKALTPDNFSSQDQITERILGFQKHYQQICGPFDWKFSRHDLDRILLKAATHPQLHRSAA